MMQELPVLLVEDDEPLARTLTRALRETAPVLHTNSVAGLIQLASETPSVWAALVDICLPDGSGLAVIEAIRARYGAIPVLVMTGLMDHDTISRAQLLGAQYLAKPVSHANLMAFFEWAARWHDSPAAQLKKLVDSMAWEHGLTPRESQVVYHAALGVAPSAIHQQMGVSTNTIKTLTRRALKKCKAPSLSTVVAPLKQAVIDDTVEEARP